MKNVNPVKRNLAMSRLNFKETKIINMSTSYLWVLKDSPKNWLDHQSAEQEPIVRVTIYIVRMR